MNNEQNGSKIDQAKRIFRSTILKNVLFTLGTITLFFAGVVFYGVLLNLREIPLAEAMREKGFRRLDDVNLVVIRKNFTLNLYQDTVLIKSYRVSFGRNLSEKKKLKNDGATPVGEYKICAVKDDDQYYKLLRINYPNLDDAAEALRKGLITQQQLNDLRFQFYYEGCTSAETELGGNIGIHGLGRLNYVFKNLPFVYNWTNGSIAMSNENIDEILTVVKEGTKIVIR